MSKSADYKSTPTAMDTGQTKNETELREIKDSRMKRYFKLTCFLLICTSILLLQSFYPLPESKDKQLLSKAELYSMKFPQEKIYLQFDRSSYWSGDDIWFKAYLKDSPIPACNLYVELLNSSGNVVLKKMYWAQNGLAYGDFHLKDTISSGVYQIRAYTNWMRNFDDFWFFRKNCGCGGSPT